MKFSNVTKDRANYITKFVAFFCTKWLIVAGCLVILARILDVGAVDSVGEGILFGVIIGVPLFYWWYHFTYLEFENLFMCLDTFDWIKIRLDKIRVKKV